MKSSQYIRANKYFILFNEYVIQELLRDYFYHEITQQQMLETNSPQQ